MIQNISWLPTEKRRQTEYRSKSELLSRILFVREYYVGHKSFDWILEYYEKKLLCVQFLSIGDFFANELFQLNFINDIAPFTMNLDI